DLELQISSERTKRDELTDVWTQRDLQFKRISNSLRIVAHHLDALMQQSPLAALDPDRMKRIKPFLERDHAPGLDDLPSLVNLFFDEIAFSGKIGLRQASYLSGDGKDRTASILTVGKFTAAYGDSAQAGFLTYLPESRRLSASTTPPPHKTQEQMLRYMRGREESAPVDLSNGAALRRAVSRPTLTSRLNTDDLGSPGFVVIGVGAIVVFVVLFRTVFSRRERGRQVRSATVPGDRSARRETASSDEMREPMGVSVARMVASVARPQIWSSSAASRKKKTALGMRRRKRVGVHVDMTPMVDVAFILLIFFMVTTLFRRPLAMEVNVPEPNAKVQVPASNVMTVYVERDGTLVYDVGQLGLTSATWGELRDLFALELEYNPEIIVLIKIDSNARFEKMVDILDAVDEAKIKRYSVVPMTDADRTSIGGGT
ncbi:MAG TPA: biopolymer transporter ExbD, partial [Candidatus Bathyarchaeia archaeon]|nr:biopolymer transporter ExbD [Candidatus Bathyarchaeia archaeon]